MVASPSTISPLFDAAVEYAQRGWRVFPLAADSKVPLIAKRFGGRGCLDATADEGQVRQWWVKYRSANIGWAMGIGYVTIDEDTYKGANLSSWYLPPTLRSRTAHDGLHHIYSYAGKLPCVPEGELAPGVCVRGEGGYIVAPPSRFQGKFYRFEDPHQPIVELPERIAELIRTYRGASQPKTTERNGRNGGVMNASDAQRWLAWAMQKTGAGRGDWVGYLLAQQLLVNGVADVDGTLLSYARQATLNPREPFTQRDCERWRRSAEQSNLVKRGEPARSQRIAPSVTERPHVDTKSPQSVTEHAEPDTETLEETAESTTSTEQDEPEETDDAALLRFSADDTGNAEAMRLIYGREFLYSPVYGWMKWSETHWLAVPDAIVVRYVITALKRRRHAAVEAGNESVVRATSGSHARVRGCMALFMAYVIVPSVDIFDSNPDELNCLNGVVNLRTGRITPHTSSQRFTYCVPVPYDAHADMTAWESFIAGALGEIDDKADVARYLQACAGYSLTGHTNAEKVFYLYGPTRSGKGTFTETLLALLPTPLSTEVDFTTFTAQRDADAQNFDLAGLKPARLVFASESNKRQKLNPARMKQFSGGNQIRCAFKHRDMFEYRPQFSVWLVSNHPVNADADDDALWGRLHVIEFPISRLGHEDVTIKEGMKSPASQRGVLRWLIEGAQGWYRAGRVLSAPARVMRATSAQRDEQDYVRQWLDECCVLEPASDWLSSARLYGSYQTWCKTNTLIPMRPNELGETLRKRFGVRVKRQAGTGARGYAGIALKSDGQESLWETETGV